MKVHVSWQPQMDYKYHKKVLVDAIKYTLIIIVSTTAVISVHIMVQKIPFDWIQNTFIVVDFMRPS